MTFTPMPEVARLNSLREVVSWAMGAYAPAATLAEVDATLTGTVYEWDDGKIDYGDCPGHEHAYWLLRFGLFGVSTIAEVRRLRTVHAEDCDCRCHDDGPDRRTRRESASRCTIGDRRRGGCFHATEKLFHKVTRGRKMFDQERRLYDLVTLCRGAGIPADVRSWIEHVVGPDVVVRRNGQRGPGGWLPFDTQQVRAAITASRRSDGASAPARAADPAQDGARATLRIIHRGTALVPGLVDGRPRLVPVADGGAFGTAVGADGGMLAHHAGTALRVATVNRVSGEIADWPDLVSLADLPEGRVLAVDRAGDADLAFVWVAAGVGTRRYRVRRGSAPKFVEHLSPRCAVAAVLDRDRTLLAFPTAGARTVSCAAFPSLSVTSLVAARGGGQTAVLATGLLPDGRERTCVERNGELRGYADGSLLLRLGAGWRDHPEVVDGEGRPVPVTQERAIGRPYAHWITRATTLRRGHPCVDSPDRWAVG